jgi:hypothetical protein
MGTDVADMTSLPALTLVCSFSEYLTHAPCLRQVQDDEIFCAAKLVVKFEEVSAKMEDLDMTSPHEIFLELYRGLRNMCW